MKKYLIIGAGMLPLAACTDSGQQQEKPNVIFIIADDLGYGDLSATDRSGSRPRTSTRWPLTGSYSPVTMPAHR